MEINTTVIAEGGGSSTPESCTSAGVPANYQYVLNALDGAGKPAFDPNADGKLDDVAMLFIGAGGYSRNVALTHLISRDSMTRPLKIVHSARESDGEGTPEATGCRRVRAVITGVGDTSEFIGVDCQSNRSWSRQQYQLTQLPN